MEREREEEKDGEREREREKVEVDGEGCHTERPCSRLWANWICIFLF